MGVHSIFYFLFSIFYFLFSIFFFYFLASLIKNLLVNTSFCKLLSDTQPAYVS